MNSQVLIDRVFLQDLLFLIKQPRTKIDARAVLVFGIERALYAAPVAKQVVMTDADHSEDVRAMVVPDVDALKAEIASLSVRLENSDAVISSIQKIITRLVSSQPTG